MWKLYISLDFMLLNNDLCTWFQNTYEKRPMYIIIFVTIFTSLHVKLCKTILHLEGN